MCALPLLLLLLFPGRGLGNSRQHSETPDFHRPVYLPDGAGLLFMSNVEDGDWELYRGRVDGTVAERVTYHAGWDGYADVSPDGHTIVFDRDGDDGHGIVLADLRTGEEEWLVRAGEEHTGGAHFAPDGRSIVYASEAPGNRELFRLWLEDRRTERITHTDQNETDGVFSPDGTKLAYAVWLADGTSTLDILDLHHQTTHRVLTSAGRLYGIAWTRDGRHLLYNDDSDGDQEIYRVDLDGRSREQLTNNDVEDHLPVSSPTAEEIVFTSERDGHERMLVMSLADRTVRVLTLAPEREPTSAR